MGAMGLNMVAALMERAPPKVLTSKDATSTQGSCVTFQNLRPGQSARNRASSKLGTTSTNSSGAAPFSTISTAGTSTLKIGQKVSAF